MIWIALASLVAAGYASLGARSLRRFSRAKLDELAKHEPTAALHEHIVQLRERTIAAADSFQALATAVAVATSVLWASNSSLVNTESGWISVLLLGILGIVALWLAV